MIKLISKDKYWPFKIR